MEPGKAGPNGLEKGWRGGERTLLVEGPTSSAGAQYPLLKRSRSKEGGKALWA